LKNRPSVLTYMEILGILFVGPKGPTRLSQSLGINFARLSVFTEPLEAKGLIRRGVQDEQEVYFITTEGAEVRRDWEKVWSKIGPD
jgi:predicted transcriptional regulator